ncbi:hypothetical protein AJ78_06653 [Emergomyces pasteurianus Ep9510]|uniref:Uncharacterized protein n=1 Tax=Emergomyces pasteurianus Ep9510 TaxID=1447872 RepID=A0A1J9QA65_9EURO|nr:hypothetical protein AJ78_06653 [Emergomyces pasteurianus Ep9510]
MLRSGRQQRYQHLQQQQQKEKRRRGKKKTKKSPASYLTNNTRKDDDEAERSYVSIGYSRIEPKKTPHLTVFLRFNRKIRALVKPEELKHASILLSIHIADGHRLSTETYQYGLTSGRVVNPLENILRHPGQIHSIQILLPASSQIPWNWEAATRVVECRYRVWEYDKVITKGRVLDRLVEQEGVVAKNLERLSDGRDWLRRYERIVDEEAVVKTRNQWVLEWERLKKEDNALGYL